jgi:Bacteriophage HK97-gp10, putative tail-component
MLACDIDLSEYRALVGRSWDVIEQALDRAVETAAQEGAEYARKVGQYQDRTGRLRSGITAYFVSGGRSVTWEILSPAPYSMFIEAGTRPHVIRPKRARALRFEIGGQVIFAGKVNHPGTKPYPFAGPGMQQAERTLMRELEKLPIALQRVWAA